MCHSRKINTQTNKLHERRLGLAYNDKRSPFREFLERDDSVTIHERNIQILLTKIFQVKSQTAPEIMTPIFNFKDNSYDLRKSNCFRGKLLNHVSLVVKTVSNIQSNFCDILPENIKKAEYFHEFRNKIKYWTPLNCPSILCLTYIANVWLRLSILIHEVPNLPNLKIVS